MFGVSVLPWLVVTFLVPWLAVVVPLAMIICSVVPVTRNLINTTRFIQGKGLDLINCCRGPPIHDVIPERIGNLDFLL